MIDSVVLPPQSTELGERYLEPNILITFYVKSQTMSHLLLPFLQMNVYFLEDPVKQESVVKTHKSKALSLNP
jgi:hypothetical protein